LNRAGIANRPFSSRLCFERPLNIDLTDMALHVTFLHFMPLYSFLLLFVKTKMTKTFIYLIG
jgi:hypothetical protein